MEILTSEIHSMCKCVCLYVCARACVLVHVCVHMFTCAGAHMCSGLACAYMYVCAHMCTHVCLRVCVYMHVCSSVCVYTCVVPVGECLHMCIKVHIECGGQPLVSLVGSHTCFLHRVSEGFVISTFLALRLQASIVRFPGEYQFHGGALLLEVKLRSSY